MAVNESYLLAGGAAELERLTLQARVWQPESEAMLDQIWIQPGFRAVDLGCGAMGILEPLSRRVGANGEVFGLDLDSKQLNGALMLIHEHGLDNVHILERDAYNTHLPSETFDFVHVRFVFAPVGRDDELLTEMLRLVKPGGIIAIQEPDASSWNCYPAHPSWETLKKAVLAAFERGGGDFNAGQRMYHLVRRSDLQDVHIRSAVIPLTNKHPYMRSPLQFATSLRQRILDNGILSPADLDQAVEDVEAIVSNPETLITTFTVHQVWGYKPA